jgi:hypothetical protein
MFFLYRFSVLLFPLFLVSALTFLPACGVMGGDSLYVPAAEVGEVEESALVETNQKIEKSRAAQKISKGKKGSSSVAIQELPKEALEKGKRKSEEMAAAEASPEPSPMTEEISSLATESPAPDNSLSSVEILWASSELLPDAYLIRYGFDRENLSEEIRVEANEVQQRQDPEYGLVNMYTLRNIPSQQSVFVSLANVVEGSVSSFSEVMELSAE